MSTVDSRLLDDYSSSLLMSTEKSCVSPSGHVVFLLLY